MPPVFANNARGMVGLRLEWTEQAARRAPCANVRKLSEPPAFTQVSALAALSSPLLVIEKNARCLYLRLQNFAFPGFFMTEGSFLSPSDVATQHVPPSPSAS